ncbi:MAG TPA: ATP-binding protein [Pirellulales bacterium]|nr:ATP-binding protein [Pirellulales bacterium]
MVTKEERIFDRWLIAAAAVVALLVLATFLTLEKTRKLNDDAGWVAHTYEVLRALDMVSTRLLEAQAAQRLYLLSGDETALTTVAGGSAEVRDLVGRATELTRDNSRQQARLAQLREGIDELERQWTEARQIRERPAFDDASLRAAARGSQQSVAAVQRLLDEMDEAERDLLRTRSQEREDTYRLALATEVLSGVAAVIGVLAFTILLRRHLAARLSASALIAEQRERLRTTLASIGDAVITTDLRGHITSLNAQAEMLTAWQAHEAIGRPLVDVFRIVNEDTRQPVENPATRAIREGVVVGLANHTLLLARNGVERPIDDSAAPIRCSEGLVVGCVLVFRDVTERRQAEFAARDADRHKDEFLAMLAHELRNPLAPIRNALSILRLTPDDREAFWGSVETMDRQVGQMVRLIDDLLDVSRISRGKLELRKERVELAAVIRQAVETGRPLIDGAPHELELELPPQPVFLDADPIRLAQVFSNLLNNACKFTEAGGRIRIVAACHGREVTVSVEDNGIGIPPDKLEQIFGMFSQVDTSLERSRSGLGIGLTLVKTVVDLHGGRVEARSDGLGKGSRFVVVLPDRSELPHSVVVEPDEPPQVTGNRRILVVDDNRDSAETLALLLRMAGNETHLANDGYEALAVAERVQPDVILLDIGLPNLNGYDVCRRIREQPWGQDIFIAALTGWGQEEDRQRSREAGFDEHLVKPVNHAALMKLLAESQVARR